METTITLRPTELNDSILEMVRAFVKAKGFNNITISLSKKKNANALRKETAKQVKARIGKAIEEIENGSGGFISFTGDEFEAFAKSLSSK